jgi:hypothetical protein
MTTSTSTLPQKDHPSVAIILVARLGGEALAEATRALTAASQSFGVEVLVLVPTPAGQSPPAASHSLNIRELGVAPDAGEAVWRAQAVTETAADVLEFTDDEVAATRLWDDILPFRLGLIRRDFDRQVDLPEALRLAGVAPPDV